MQIFKDRDGREWQVVLNVFQMKRVRAALGVDLINVIELDKDGQVRVDMIDKIANDPCLLVDILWVLVQDQARTLNVTDEQFGTALAGDAIESATKAFLDELVDFSPARSASSCRRPWASRGSSAGSGTRRSRRRSKTPNSKSA